MISTDNINDTWQQSNLQVFWGEIAPCEHIVQIYENEQLFLGSLEGFIGSGLLADDSVIIIATSDHIVAIEHRLRKQGFDLDYLSAVNKYTALEVNDTLSKFMVNGWPDETLFFELVTSILKKVKRNNQKVRAFGEMVAVLWQQGKNGATVRLENLWNQLHKQKDFSLFCAYPKIGFTQDIHSSIETICSEHTKVIDGSPRPSTEIYYKNTVPN